MLFRKKIWIAGSRDFIRKNYQKPKQDKAQEPKESKKIIDAEFSESRAEFFELTPDS